MKKAGRRSSNSTELIWTVERSPSTKQNQKLPEAGADRVVVVAVAGEEDIAAAVAAGVAAVVAAAVVGEAVVEEATAAGTEAVVAKIGRRRGWL
jgi:ribosomal protein L18